VPIKPPASVGKFTARCNGVKPDHGTAQGYLLGAGIASFRKVRGSNPKSSRILDPSLKSASSRLVQELAQVAVSRFAKPSPAWTALTGVRS
jgi:hypothetical protein